MISVLLLLIAVVAFRLVPTGWENFSPMAAIVLCCAAYLPRRWAIAFPLAAFAITEVALNLQHGVAPVNPNTLTLTLGFAIVFALGWSLRKPGADPAARGPRLPLLFGFTLAGSLLFYLVTNTGAWIANPAYAKSLAGWAQALTTGVPGFPPTWVFFRNSLVGDLFFTGLFVALYVLLPTLHRPVFRPSAPTTSVAPSPRES